MFKLQKYININLKGESGTRSQLLKCKDSLLIITSVVRTLNFLETYFYKYREKRKNYNK